ncbi:MAG: xanthine dehydrogenase family protein molybdopterin-binding subunit [Acidimicrobiia bacterium]|nr:xanthine dehydrogenase family protein molybdopterin-binding subunit [Acidimicrobiia bacterium]
MTDMPAVGQSVRRSDARAKVTGEALYAVDHAIPDMLHGAVVRSTRAHATIEDIEKDAAQTVAGVVGVVTAADLGDLFPRFGHLIADHPILAIDKVNYMGEPVALVLGETLHAAHDGADALYVRYSDLPVMADMDTALAPEATLIHPTSYPKGDVAFEEAITEPRNDNVAHEASLEWGDVEAAMADAAVVVETSVKYPKLYAYAMEPYNALATVNEEGVDVTTTAQHPFMVRDDLARIFSLPLSKVRVRSPLLGGGYGSKSYTKLEPLASVGSWYSGRPVKVALSAEEAIYTTRADSANITVRSGFDEEGHILARHFEIRMDTGAYTDNGTLVLAKCVNRCFGPYNVPNLRAHGIAVFTNTVASSSYRGFGAPQGNLAGELNMDQAAQQLGIDPLELRKKNVLPPGGTVIAGKRGLDADLSADLDIVTDKLGWDGDSPDLSGIGFGISASDAGAYPVSTAQVRVLIDGSVLVMTGATEMGQGSKTALAQIAAHELGVALDQVQIVQSDTGSTPYERTTGASRTTVLVGLAVQRACQDAIRKLEEMAAETFDVALTDVKTADGVVVSPGTGEWPYANVLQSWFGARSGEVTGVGLVRASGELAMLPPFWEVGVSGVEVSVDPDTGKVTVEHLVTVGDVGFAINPTLVEGQDLGAAMQGLGAALYEELIYDGGQLENPNLVDYRVPHANDMPLAIDNVVVERGDGVGPYGAKGAGEGPLNPIGGAVASAVGRAIGRWPEELPLTAQRVWELMQDEAE